MGTVNIQEVSIAGQIPAVDWTVGCIVICSLAPVSISLHFMLVCLQIIFTGLLLFECMHPDMDAYRPT